MTETLPLVTLILPIRNEAAYIERCLQSILAQDYPTDRMEILITDGMSTDDTREKINTILHPLSGVYPEQSRRVSRLLSTVLVIDNPGRIVPTGMNIALRQARGEIIIRVDGHCVIAPDYVSNCVKHLQKDGVAGVGGPMESIGETSIAKAIAIGMSSLFGVGNSAFRTVSGRSMLADTVPFPAYTQEIIERAGLYDEELVRNQDDEYNYRIRELGGRIMLAGDVRSAYFSRTSMKGLWRQYFQYGYWKVRVLQKHPRQMSLRQFVPPLFVLALVISALLALLSALGLLSSVYGRLSSIIPLLYLSANLLASIYTASKRGWKYAFILPLTFAILHLSYGLGFLTGLLKFWNRWGDKIGRTPSFSRETIG
jgi:glycosyltransferase involved in cell wall biosynthesis